MADIIIVGIGNPYRGDDLAGWAVVDLLTNRVNSSIKLTKQRGDIAELIDIFTTYKCVYLIDACMSGAPVGSWKRIDLNREILTEDTPQTSTHGFGLIQAISLAKNLDQLPNTLILYAINGHTYHIGGETSPPVVIAIEKVVEEILKEKDIQSCMNRA